MQDTHSPDATLDQAWAITEQEPFRALFEEAPIAYLELDAEGIVRRVNRAQCELLGYRADDMIGKPIWTFTLNEEREASRKSIARRLAGDETVVSGRRTFVTRDLRLLTAEVRARVIFDPQGKAVGIRAALIDISERIAAQAHLLETQKWLITTLNSLSEAVLAADPLGTVKFINGPAAQLLELPAMQAVGRDLATLFGASEIRRAESDTGCTISEVLDRSLIDPLKGTVIIQGRRGTETSVEITSAPILIDGDRVVGIVIVLKRPSAG